MKGPERNTLLGNDPPDELLSAVPDSGPAVAPRWRDMVLPVLYPPAPSLESRRRQAMRAGFWLTLLGIFVAGVVLPFAAPDVFPTAPLATNPPATAASVPTATAQRYPAGTRVRDCRDDSLCPWLRVLPPGSFLMGSAASEPGRYGDEGPQHPVTIAEAFAVAETEVTRGHFAAFANESGYAVKPGCLKWDVTKYAGGPQANWRSPGFEQTDAHPVVCVGRDDATAYTVWLSKKTGQTYRLLSEAEWEYAARAGSTTRYSFGDRSDEICAHANVADRTATPTLKDLTAIAECADGYVYTAPVRSYKPNAFGLYDMHGNAWEWASDCWHDDYKNAPSDGSSWQEGCSEEDRGVPRGAGWGSDPVDARSAFRNSIAADDRIDGIGFRLARTLTRSALTPLQPTQQSKK